MDHAKRIAGRCYHSNQTLSFSKHAVLSFDDDQFKDTVLHEIAHALVGPEHGHGNVWRQKAIEIGCSGRRHCDSFAERKWVFVCPCKAVSVKRHRDSKKMRSYRCKKCDGKLEKTAAV